MYAEAFLVPVAIISQFSGACCPKLKIIPSFTHCSNSWESRSPILLPLLTRLKNGRAHLTLKGLSVAVCTTNCLTGEREILSVLKPIFLKAFELFELKIHFSIPSKSPCRLLPIFFLFRIPLLESSFSEDTLRQISPQYRLQLF